MKSIIARLRNHVRNFATARDGNIAYIFAFTLLPILGVVGAAVDYGRANIVKADLQSALDATALMVSKSAPTLTKDELQKKSEDYFNALFRSNGAGTTNIKATYVADSSTVTVSGDTSVKTDFGWVLDKLSGSPGKYSVLPISNTASVSWGSTRLRVALALDNTGSMSSNNKMTTLKTAAKDLLTMLQSAATKDGDVYVSIVPFSKDVNVSSIADATTNWINWTDWDKDNMVCTKSKYDNKNDCKDHDGKWQAANHNTWTGCVTDRDMVDSKKKAVNYDVTNNTPDVDKKVALFPAEQYSDCPVSLMPLSYKWKDLRDKIDAMKPVGNTNVTIGLSWAWQSLTKGAPLFAPAEDDKYKYTKVIILLTDGDNTENRFSNSQSAIDDRTKLACANAKAAGITLYTVLVMQGSQSLLQGCATDLTNYFYLQSASGLVDAFKQIGTELTSLRVSK